MSRKMDTRVLQSRFFSTQKQNFCGPLSKSSPRFPTSVTPSEFASTNTASCGCSYFSADKELLSGDQFHEFSGGA